MYTEGCEKDFIMRYKEFPKKDYFIRSYSEFYPCDLRLFYPVSEINDEIKKMFGDNDIENTIGFHIRRTDLKVGIKKSPLWLFLIVMYIYRILNRRTKFYIATDDLSERDKILNRFRECCIFNDKIVLGRTSEEGIKNAVVDLFALSKCKQIYGTYWSSFSDIAGRLGGIRSYPLTRYNFIRLINLYLVKVLKT